MLKMKFSDGLGMQMKWCKLDKKDITIYYKLVIMSLLYVLPIILINIYYNDDLARTLGGATGWKGDGRPLGEWLIVVLCSGKPIVDPAPLLLILSILILSYALVVYTKANLDSLTNDNLKVLLLLFIITNPFAMSNLSYRYDCIIMITALSIPFGLFSIPDTLPKIMLFFCSFVAGIAIMSLYQPAIGMCVVLLVISIFINIMDNRKQDILLRGGGSILGVIVYKITIGHHYISRDDWRYEATQVVDFNFGSIKIVISNIISSCKFILSYVTETAVLNQIVLAVFIIFSLVAILILYIREGKQRGWRKIMDAIFLALSPIFAFVSTFLPLMFVQSLGIKSRIYLAYGGFLFYMGILLLYKKKRRIFVTVLMAICILYQYIYMYQYGNALKSQKEYEKYMVYNIAHDLESINSEGDFSTFSIVGQMPKSSQVQMICDKYPFFNSIIPMYINNSEWIGGAWVYHYLQDDLKLDGDTESDLAIINSTDPVMTNARYSCYLDCDKIIIYFH